MRTVRVARTSRATRMACSSLVMSPSLPGTVGTPAACNVESMLSNSLRMMRSQTAPFVALGHRRV